MDIDQLENWIEGDLKEMDLEWEFVSREERVNNWTAKAEVEVCGNYYKVLVDGSNTGNPDESEEVEIDYWDFDYGFNNS